MLNSSYVLLDNSASPRGCAVRQALSSFWQWYYQSSSSYNAIMGSYITATIPSLTRTQLGLLNTLQANLLCMDQPLNATSATTTEVVRSTVTMVGPQRLSVAMTANGEFYSSNNSDVQFAYKNQLSATAMQLAQQSATVLPFYYPDNVNTTATPIDTARFRVLPTLITSIVYTHNLQLSATVTLNSTVELVIDFATVLRIIAGNITDWHDPRILALNPVLAIVLDSSPAPITFVFACLNPVTGWPLFEAISEVRSALAAVDADVFSAEMECASIGVFNAFATCQTLPGTRWLLANGEVAIPALVSNTIGSIGYSMDNTNVLGNGKFAIQYPYRQSDGTLQPVVRHSNPDGLLACARSGFDAATLSIDVAAAALSTDDCYPASQVVLTQVPNSYADDDVQVGVVTVEALQWLYSTSALDAYGDANMIVRTAAVSAIQSALLNAVHSVTDADGDPLIRLPITWTLTQAIGGVTLLLASLGGALTVVAMAVTSRYSSHPVFRSSSPLFMLVWFLGLLHITGAIVTLGLTQTNASCIAFTWCTQLGFTLVFAPLFAKAYRIYRIFGRRKLKVVKLTNRKLLVAVGITFAIDAVYVAVWNSVAPPTVVTTVQFVATSTGAGNAQQYDYPMCSYAGQSSSFFVAEAVIKLAMLAIGVMLAFGTRQVNSQFNESKSIGICIYNLVFAIGLIVPIMLLVDAVGDTYTLLLLFCLAEILYFTLCVLFLPKLLAFPSGASSGRRRCQCEQQQYQPLHVGRLLVLIVHSAQLASLDAAVHRSARAASGRG